jgi:tellurite resistance protein
MDTASPTQYSSEQITAWLRGLVTVAWADGQFSDAEKALIDQLVTTELAPDLSTDIYEPITPKDLEQQLGSDTSVGENFLRTAVMVALADGMYSTAEDQILESFCQALSLQVSALESLRHTLDLPRPRNITLMYCSPCVTGSMNLKCTTLALPDFCVSSFRPSAPLNET